MSQSPNPRALAILAAALLSLDVCASVEVAQPNDNREPAGRLRNGVLQVALEARAARWYPESEEGSGFEIQAFAERGRLPAVPGPLIRVPEGTRIRASLRNDLPDTLVLHGFHTRPGAAGDVVSIPAGELREFDFPAGAPGTYYYYASTMATVFRSGRPGYRDAVLHGAFIIDARNERRDPGDRIFVLGSIRKDPALDDATSPRPGSGQKRAYSINGLGWPFTERLAHHVGDEVRWRWINTTYEPHPLHLHGFYFDVLSVGDGERDTPFAAPMRPRVFTQRVEIGGTLAIRWSPDREGNWLFHCHMLDHIGPHLRLRPPPAREQHGHDHAQMDHVRDGMTGLVLGLTVKPRRVHRAAPAAAGARELRLFVQAQAGRFGDKPAYGYALQEGESPPIADRVDIPGPLLVLNAGEPTRIAITNRTELTTSVHWHGMELESYFDGVPGWGGDSRRVTPPISPGETFVAEMTPPRAGTFMYHTHWHDEVQLKSGMYGPLIVLPAGARYDTNTERLVVVSSSPMPGALESVFINGALSPPPLEMRVGTTYRIRCMNITASHVNHFVRLAAGDQPVVWRNVAKDAIELPPEQVVDTDQALSLAVGETRDFEFTPATAGDLRVEIRLPNGGLRTSIDVRVRAADQPRG
jgi:FtsP/CotA-like multicopper oxidase with cupredoxin domain